MGKDDLYFAIGTVLAAAGLLGSDLKLIWARCSKLWSKSPNTQPSSGWGREVMVLLALIGSLAMSSYGWYKTSHLSPIIVEKTVTDTYKFRYSGDSPPSKRFQGQSFENQEVLLDDSSYIDCTFRNVTFIYNGTSTFVFEHNVISGYVFQSDNPSINNTMRVLYGLGQIKENVAVFQRGTPHLPVPGLTPPIQTKH